jgi:hypothetical protein
MLGWKNERRTASLREKIVVRLYGPHVNWISYGDNSSEYGFVVVVLYRGWIIPKRDRTLLTASL